jgi:hypothetical protein
MHTIMPGNSFMIASKALWVRALFVAIGELEIHVGNESLRLRHAIFKIPADMACVVVNRSPVVATMCLSGSDCHLACRRDG